MRRVLRATWGGQLELIQLKNGRIKNRSLSDRSVKPDARNRRHIDKADKIIQRELDSVAFLKKNRVQDPVRLGAWRAVARIHMGLRHYPLSVLHHYELSKFRRYRNLSSHCPAKSAFP